mmetsp:Transcript_9345/g.23870  ORF Transcript_9345/g.23870 Transcript_9345/m.23870 type:complete len:242 (-) Transcript_9345:590-1315(-)
MRMRRHDLLDVLPRRCLHTLQRHQARRDDSGPRVGPETATPGQDRPGLVFGVEQDDPVAHYQVLEGSGGAVRSRQKGHCWAHLRLVSHRVQSGRGEGLLHGVCAKGRSRRREAVSGPALPGIFPRTGSGDADGNHSAAPRLLARHHKPSLRCARPPVLQPARQAGQERNHSQVPLHDEDEGKSGRDFRRVRQVRAREPRRETQERILQASERIHRAAYTTTLKAVTSLKKTAYSSSNHKPC